MTDRRGVVLLEVLVALAILASVAAAIVSACLRATVAVDHLGETEARVRAASAFLENVVLWSAVEYDQRLGERSQGPWRLRILRPRPDLYALTVLDSSGTAMVETLEHRAP